MKNHGSTNTQEVGELDDDNRPASNQESEDEDSQDITRSHSSAYQLRRHPVHPEKQEKLKLGSSLSVGGDDVTWTEHYIRVVVDSCIVSACV